MYQASEALDKVISGSGRTFYARLNGISDGIQEIVQTNFSTPDSYFYVGGAIASKIEVSMFTKLQEFVKGKEVRFEIGATADGTIEWIPMGYFTIKEQKKDRNLLTFTAYDRLESKLAKAYKSKIVKYPVESKEFLTDISEQTGVEFDTSKLPDSLMIDKILTVNDQSGEKSYKEPFDGFTMQQVVGYIAQLHGTFAICDRSGKVTFRWYEALTADYPGKIGDTAGSYLKDQNLSFIYNTIEFLKESHTYLIKTNRYFDDLLQSETMCQISGISCDTENNHYESGTNINTNLSNPVMTQEWLNKILKKIKDMSYYPVSFSFMGDPRLDVGDVVTIVDAKNNLIDVPVMQHTITFDGGLLSEVASYGFEEKEAKSPSQIALQRVKDDILTLQEITAKKATFNQLNAVDAKITNLQASSITTNDANILFARLDKANIQQGWITSAMIGDAQITNAKIQDMSADKLTAGVIDASIITVKNLNADSITVGKINWKQLSDDVNATITDSKNTANAALSTADGKNAVFYQSNQPSATGRKTNDVWYDTGNGNAMYCFDGNVWVKKVFGNNALDNISASKITTGTLDAKKVTLINLDAGSITTGTITGLDAIFNRSFTVNSPYSDTQSFIIEADQNNIIIGTRTKDALYSTNDNSIIFSPTGVALQGGNSAVVITAKHDVTIGTDGGSIYLNANGTTYNDIPIYARNDVYTFKILHEGNTTLKSEFSSGVEIGSINLGTLSMTLKVPLASTTQSGLITASEKSKLNTDYLPLTGGTLGSSNVNVLGLNCTSGMMSTLRFYGSGKRLGSVGFNAQNSSLYRWNTSGTAYRILDENDLPLMADSGWVNITLGSGIAAVSYIGARVRKIGNMVNVVMGVTGATAAFQTLGTLAQGYRPTKEINLAARYYNSPTAAIAIGTDGTIKVLQTASGGSSYNASGAISFSITYFI